MPLPGTVCDGRSAGELESAAFILGLGLLIMGTTHWYTDCRAQPGARRQAGCVRRSLVSRERSVGGERLQNGEWCAEGAAARPGRAVVALGRSVGGRALGGFRRAAAL